MMYEQISWADLVAFYVLQETNNNKKQMNTNTYYKVKGKHSIS